MYCVRPYKIYVRLFWGEKIHNKNTKKLSFVFDKIGKNKEIIKKRKDTGTGSIEGMKRE
jgi:hypothetical protein